VPGVSARPCIALVDDDPDLRDLLDRYLSGFGMVVRVYADGESLLRAAGAGLQMDAVVLDLMLPGIDGLEVCQRLRAGSGVPVLMLTARGELLDRKNKRPSASDVNRRCGRGFAGGAHKSGWVLPTVSGRA
jgi:two-component system OmpR family response regulator